MKSLRLLQLYPVEMNIYGDKGNVLAITKRLKWHGFDVELLEHHPGAVFPKNVDMVLGGGGQDSGQDKIRDDLLSIGNDLHKLADSDVPMLMICGLYQLFGRFFQTAEGDKIEGISIFKAETVAGKKRLIGNILTESETLGKIVGFENHSGLTSLDSGQEALAKVIKGAGNNGKDRTEGAIYRNVLGSYLHGSLLPKNPKIADMLIEQAVLRKFGSFEPKTIDDDYAELARKVALTRGR